MLETHQHNSSTTQTARKHSFSISVLAIIMGISGFLLALAAVLILVKSSALNVLLSGYTILKWLPLSLAALVVIIIGLLFISAAVGVWYRMKWAFLIGLILSLLQVVISVLGDKFTSFIFIRGLIVLVSLLALRRHFLHPEQKMRT